MRIIGGQLKGLKLAPISGGRFGAQLRPTSVRARQSIFDVLTNGAHGDLVADRRVLDLFAGSGALGLEALSRWAQAAVFVDRSATARELIATNIGRARLGPRASILALDATSLPPCEVQPFDLVLIDPPHGRALALPALREASAKGWLADGATVMIEESTPTMPPGPHVSLYERRVGNVHISIAHLDQRSAAAKC